MIYHFQQCVQRLGLKNQSQTDKYPTLFCHRWHFLSHQRCPWKRGKPKLSSLKRPHHVVPSQNQFPSTKFLLHDRLAKSFTNQRLRWTSSDSATVEAGLSYTTITITQVSKQIIHFPKLCLQTMVLQNPDIASSSTKIVRSQSQGFSMTQTPLLADKRQTK